MEIQRDIAKRRRRKLVLLLTRLAFFVFLPTLIAGYYFYAIATPMYATKSEFVIQKADTGARAGSAACSPAPGFATSQDSITVQSYLTSRDAMLRLDADLGFKAHFQNPEIDPIQRLDAERLERGGLQALPAQREDRLRPDRGDHQDGGDRRQPRSVSAAFSEALIRYAEETGRQPHPAAARRPDGRARSRATKRPRSSAPRPRPRCCGCRPDLRVLDADLGASSVMSQVTTLRDPAQRKTLCSSSSCSTTPAPTRPGSTACAAISPGSKR